MVVSLIGVPGKAEYAELMTRGEALLARQEFHVIITDLRELKKPADSAQREELSEWTLRMEAQYGQSRVASIKILNSRVVRAALVVFRWLSGNQREDVFVGTMDEALQVARHLCRKHGMTEATGLKG